MIEITIKTASGKNLSLTPEEAKEVYDQLHQLYGPGYTLTTSYQAYYGDSLEQPNYGTATPLPQLPITTCMGGTQ